MPNVQSIYVKRGLVGGNDAQDEEEKAMIAGIKPDQRLKIKNYLIKRNENAARAAARFPNETDLDVILSKTLHGPAGKQSAKGHTGEKPEEASFSVLQDSTMVHDPFVDHHGNFADYLSGKIPIVSPAIAAGGNQFVGGGNLHELMLSQ